MLGFITRRRHDAEMAAKDLLIDSLDKTAALYKQRAEFWQETAEQRMERLLQLTPARDPVTKRFVGKAVSNG